jgi:N-acetyl-gamma-glutamyl-phosphate reductase
MTKLKVGVIGHTGCTGKELVKILNKHPKVEIVYTNSRSEGEKGDIEPPQLVFCCTDAEISQKVIPLLIRARKRVIDFSRAYRYDKDAVYGLPEKNRKQIKEAKLVANPGCYVTAALLPLIPIAPFIENVKISAISGISGAGLDVTGKDNLKAYKIGREHDHVKEIEEHTMLSNIVFVPVINENMYRGILMTIFGNVPGPVSIAERIRRVYANEKFVRIKDNVELKDVIGTNFCDISISTFSNDTIIISALDNLVKGASGQAVQNMNIMYGFDETEGLLEQQ